MKQQALIIRFNSITVDNFGASPRATIDAGALSAALIVTGSVTITGIPQTIPKQL